MYVSANFSIKRRAPGAIDFLQKRRPKMGNLNQEKEAGKKKGFGEKFMDFLVCGGFLVIIVVIVALAFVVDRLLK
jgi:hypothetical protein